MPEPILLANSQHSKIKSGKFLSKEEICIKSWECSGKDRGSKYLEMTWDCLNDHYLLKFRLNLHKKSHRIPSGADLDSEFLQDQSAPIYLEECQSHRTGIPIKIFNLITVQWDLPRSSVLYQLHIVQGTNQQILLLSQQDPAHQKYVFSLPNYLQLLRPALHLLHWQPARQLCLRLCLLRESWFYLDF